MFTVISYFKFKLHPLLPLLLDFSSTTLRLNLYVLLVTFAVKTFKYFSFSLLKAMIPIGLMHFCLGKVNSSQMSFRGCSKYGPLPAFCPLWSCRKCYFSQWVASFWIWLLIELCWVHQRIGASVCLTPCWFSSLLVSFAHLIVLLPRSLYILALRQILVVGEAVNNLHTLITCADWCSPAAWVQ